MNAAAQPDSGPAFDVLRERARQLALPRQVALDQGRDMIVFTCAGERYALGTDCVEKATAHVVPVRLPGCGPHIAGIAAVDGEVVSAIDMRILLGLPIAAAPPARRLLVVRDGDMECGLLADEIVGVARLAPAPAGAPVRAPAYGIAADGTAMLDLPALLGLVAAADQGA